MKKKEIFLIVLLVVILAAAYFGYANLSREAEPETVTTAETTGQTTAAPDFTVKDAGGNAVSFSDITGKPMVLNFWATWCGPCQSELPAFEEAYKTYGDRVTFMMINLTDGARDTEEGVKAFVAENGYTFPVYLDTDYSAALAYNIYSIPLTVFVDENGNIAASQTGAMSESTLTLSIDALLS